MKRKNNLFSQVYDLDNLRAAAKAAAKDKGDYYGVKKFNKDPDRYLKELQTQLQTKTFRTSRYRSRDIWEGKKRTLNILPYYPDNILDHAIIQVIGGIIESTFTADTYSCIKGRGTGGCRLAVLRMIEETKEWEHLYIFKADVHHYFPSTDHGIMKARVREKIKDADLLDVLDEIIDSIEGTPIGRYLSQYTSNWYLSPFDHWVKERLPILLSEYFGRKIVLRYYFRYMDDLTLGHDEKAVLHVARLFIEEKLAKDFKLSIKDNWQVFPVAEHRGDHKGRALDFVGFRFYRGQTLIRTKIKKSFAKKVASLRYVTKKQIAPYIGWVKYSNAKHLFNNLTKSNYYDFTLRPKTESLRTYGQRVHRLPLRHRRGDGTCNGGD